MNTIEAMQMAAYDLFELQNQRDSYAKALKRLLRAKGDHMTACDRTMGATHPCTCGADNARKLLKEAKDEKW